MIYFYMGGILLSFVLLHLYIFTQSVALKYEVTNLKLKYKEMKSDFRDLSYILAQKEALPKIEQLASKIGMAYPERVNYIILSTEAK
ncbi:hypothetical protein HZC34_01140 [Candidatus Saganbacteria bacterium]|nr:hypothetical protein [Candidatus Saganbacteria bacterium]